MGLPITLTPGSAKDLGESSFIEADVGVLDNETS